MNKRMYFLVLLVFLLAFCVPGPARSSSQSRLMETKRKAYQIVPEAKFRNLFKEYLCCHLRKDKSDILISRFKVVGNKPVPWGKLAFRLFQKQSKELKAYVRLVAIISVNGIVRNSVYLSGWIDVFDSVVCSSRNLPKGDIIKREDLYLAKKNISYLSRNIFTDMNKVVGLRVRHSIKQDMPLESWMLERPPILEKGDKVTILFETKNLRITVPGKVLEKGYLGKLVRVENSMSCKKIFARVVNKATVVADF